MFDLQNEDLILINFFQEKIQKKFSNLLDINELF